MLLAQGWGCHRGALLVKSESELLSYQTGGYRRVCGRDRLGLGDCSRRRSAGALQCEADPVLVIPRNVVGQWNQVFVQPLPEEEVTVRHDQDPRVSWI